jgi:hypothetical protein
MANIACGDLKLNFLKACGQLRILIERFDGEHWNAGVSRFETPANVAFHAIDCLDFYFTPSGTAEYKWGWRFGGGWWELPDEKKPGPGQLVNYLAEIEGKIAVFFDRIEDADLARPHAWGCSNLRFYLYALRHTMHHQGGLNVLAVHAGIDMDGWADEP